MNAPEINIRQTRLMDGSKAKLPFGCKTRNISSRHCFNRIVNILIHCSIRGIACLFNTPATVIITTASSANNTIYRHIASIASTHSLVPWHDNTPLPSCIEIFASYITRKHSIWQFSTTIIDFTFHSSSLTNLETPAAYTTRNTCPSGIKIQSNTAKKLFDLVYPGPFMRCSAYDWCDWQWRPFQTLYWPLARCMSWKSW